MRVYVNWRDEDILMTKQYEDLIEEKVNKLENNEDAFIEWLDRNYNASELWEENVTQRELVKERWHDHCWNEVIYDLSCNYDEYDIEED